MSNLKDINAIPVFDRPRERLQLKGINSLTSSELLAIILGSGSKENGIFEIVAVLLEKYKNLKGLSRANVNELENIKGIGKVKASRLIACFELVRRIYGEEQAIRYSIKNSQDLYEILKPRLIGSDVEIFIVICLDSRRRVLAIKNISSGTINQTLVHPREVFNQAILIKASYIAIAHNHPSGDVTPSSDDLEITRKIGDISKTIGIPLIDHIIVSDSEYLSLNEEGFFEDANIL